ncbi:MAG TPA: hypothetical protein VN380_12220 [Thermoanaerobaculia bacterium]|nr:hypothetical protein [Thermoanaerobaculia bacterium]
MNHLARAVAPARSHSQFRRILTLLPTLLAWSVAVVAKGPIDMAAGCKANPALAGSCFVVRGRLSAYNGTPTFRIWPVGTHCLLGVIPSEDPRSLPGELRGVAGFEQDVFGTFTVCPFTKRRAGVMQFVCVETVRNVDTRKHPFSRRQNGSRRTRG